MKEYVVVYVANGRSYLARWIPGGGLYETQAEGDAATLKMLAAKLNGEDKG